MKASDVRQKVLLDLGERAGARSPRRASVPHVSPLKKVLMTLMVLGAMGTTVGAGTFASFNASTTNASNTFATGSVVLSDTVSASSCFSTGGSTATNTNTNSESASCTAMFTDTNASLARPGEQATGDIDLVNKGTLAAVLSGYMTGSNCTDGNSTVSQWPSYFSGSGSPCQNLQMSVQSYADAARTTPNGCLFGRSASGMAEASSAVGSLTITTSNNNLTLQVNGGVGVTATITSASPYASYDALAANLETQLQSATGLAVQVGVTTDNKIQISSPTAGASSSIKITGGDAVTNLGLTSQLNQTYTGGATACTLGPETPDNVHTLSLFQSFYASAVSGLQLGTLTANGGTKYLSISLMLPYGADNQLQGRRAQFDMSWSLLST